MKMRLPSAGEPRQFSFFGHRVSRAAVQRRFRLAIGLRSGRPVRRHRIADLVIFDIAGFRGVLDQTLRLRKTN